MFRPTSNYKYTATVAGSMVCVWALFLGFMAIA